MRMPEAELDVSAELVSTLIGQQHPDLAGPLTLLANGWDNVIFLLGPDLLVRLPRRQVAAQLVINEQRWLPVIAPGLPAPVPVPVRVGTPTPDFPWPWSICRWVPGAPLTAVPVTARSVVARPLAEFLAALHRPAPAEAVHGPDRPVNPVRGVPLADRDELTRGHLASGAVPDPDRLGELWQRLLDAPAWDREPVWVHGDPHPGNLLVHEDRLAAVIDFGDVTVGDPATDLATAWLSLDADGREVFRRRYTELTHATGTTGAGRATWDRARGWALSIGLSLLVNSDDNPVLAAVGRHALARIGDQDRGLSGGGRPSDDRETGM